MSQKKLLNRDWLFAKQPIDSDLHTVRTERIDWMPVTLPHDWLINDSNNLYETGEGWYRKNLHFDETVPGNRLSLRFEGVYMNSSIYVNGQLAGNWKYGYSTFEIDITPYITAGINEIYVRVIHESPNSRWYSGAGIYRNVWLKTYSDTHIVPDGIYISATKAGKHWNVEIDTEIRFGSEAAAPLNLRHRILDAAGELITQIEAEVSFETESTACITTILSVSDPVVWDIDQPYCYSMKTELIADGLVIEEEIQNFGFRTLEFHSAKGFFLNGRYVKLQGVCQHHDLGCLGAAVNKAALRRQMVLLQEMGVNAIRTAHNMPAVELMELADEMGVLIVSEAFDMWERKKTPYDYARFFPQWWRKDVASWIRRDRNHPSMIMWSLGNEIYDTHADERGQEITAELRDEVLRHDPKSNAVVTIGSNYMPWENARKCADLVKFAGYNYGEKYYDRHHQEHPDWIIYGSETSSTVQSRGIYHFPLAQSVLSDDDEQCSSLGNSSTSWGARSTEACIIADRDTPFSLGQFLWTGFDYIGEPTPYFTKNSYFGQIDTAGFKKDSFYIYQAEWTHYKVKPMVHIFPYWDFSDGQLIDVRVCSNAPKIELFLNDRSMGTFDIDHNHGLKLLGEWQIPYRKGVLRAVAYDEKGNIIASDVKSSFGNADSLVMVPDKTLLAADGSDLIFVEISAVDQAGHPVENANNRVHITVEGPGRLVGLDNGDSTDFDSYKGTHRRMFSGKLLAVVASTLEPGSITVRAESNKINSCEFNLNSMAPEPALNKEHDEYALYAYAPSNLSDNSEEINPEIPVRKLELICPQGNWLSIQSRSLPVKVKIHPENATYQDVQWRITNTAGIDANIATLVANGHEAVITALGDGDVYVRCSTTNGSDKIKLYSLMEFHIDGMGQAYLNPYEFVSAGYHNESRSRNLTNGNERGVASGRDGESVIGFDNIDFGSYGSDEITLPVFSLDDEEFPIEIWEGYPGEEKAALVTSVTYQKPSIWNTYQEATYKLPKRLKGITSLCFVLRRKIHLKGFRFQKPMKAYQRLTALENSKIYGDSFTLGDEAIQNIGNNVSLVFEEMDFGETGTGKLVICGHSPIDKNTLHIMFSGPNGETRERVEFTYSEDYIVREFPLERITGLQTVTFVFLPGSQFDFKWFQFQGPENE
ncbi:glycoside hydrolase family 2 TIM barrel-domain containing protein [Fontibacillus sp. BL9]|uniref:glycoside hydrolase family 2 TIM barrel-domain containing protein n=1 Tax=Fontibacillus sp. BL9 TaxID=3389971 RepID=UPI00397CF163